jgi:glutathione S-transferase
MLTLFHTPGACSINPHIALREAGLPFELVKVDLRAKTYEGGGDYLAINPKGYVPALRLESGDVLTENVVMTQYIADLVPEKKLAPPVGTIERLRLAEALVFISTELHKGMSPFYNPLVTGELKASLAQRLGLRWAYLEKCVGEKRYLFGDGFTIADGYALYVLRAWQRVHKQEITPGLAAYYARLLDRPSVQQALEAEGLTG